MICGADVGGKIYVFLSQVKGNLEYKVGNLEYIYPFFFLSGHHSLTLYRIYRGLHRSLGAPLQQIKRVKNCLPRERLNANKSYPAEMSNQIRHK